MAVAVLPLLKVGGMQLMNRESSDTSDKILARPRQLATSLLGVYLGLTVMAAIAYGVTGMDAFAALTHAMATVSTGGYSTHDNSSVGAAPAAQWVPLVFMLAGAVQCLHYTPRTNGRE